MSQPDGKFLNTESEIDKVKKILAHCTSHHVDILIKEWLSSEEAIFRKIGANALGKIRISRAVPYLIKSLDNRAENIDVLEEICNALGYIGGNDAVRALLQHQQIEPIAYALGELDDFKIYDKSLQKLLLLKKSNGYKNPQTSLLVYRAIGLQKDKRYINDLRQLLHASEAAQRGVAALALARVNGIQELNTLRKAYAESDVTLEHILVGLGLIEIRSPERNDILGELRRHLTIESHLFIRHFQEDILSIFRNTRNPLAILIANSWELVYNEMSLVYH